MDELIEQANELQSKGFRFEFMTYGTGWFVKPDAEHWLLRTPQGAALPFYEAVKKIVRLVKYLESQP